VVSIIHYVLCRSVLDFVNIFEQPFVKWFALCYWTVVCPVCGVDVLWPNGWMDQDPTWCEGRPRPSPHCVRWGVGTQLPPPQKGHSPQFSVHVCCGQTAAWIKTPLVMEVGLGPGNFVLDVAPAPPPKKRGHSPQFLAHIYCGQAVAHLSYC